MVNSAGCSNGFIRTQKQGPEGLFEEIVGSGLVSVRFGLCGLILWSLSWAEASFGRICSKMTVTSLLKLPTQLTKKKLKRGNANCVFMVMELQSLLIVGFEQGMGGEQ